MAPRFSLFLKILLSAAAAVLILAATHSLWLPAVGYALVREDAPAKADIAVVLAGDLYGNRVLKGAELVKQGYAPAVLVSGPAAFYGLHECDLAIPFAVRRGYPESWFIPFPNAALSTKEEAAFVLSELRRRGVRSYLLVTSNYHTARAARIFREAERKAGGGPEMRVVAASDRFFRPGSWWRNREGRKTVFLEWTKLAANAVGL